MVVAAVHPSAEAAVDRSRPELVRMATTEDRRHGYGDGWQSYTPWWCKHR
ncbi:hypothetical protein GS506_02145 [Rhodococcus hoagii]|nr:hypothetical protein [Prescottella equi]